jgi:hypothetical protein
MPKWILGPIDHRAEIWNTYPVQRLVVEATAEREARDRSPSCSPRGTNRTLGWIRF